MLENFLTFASFLMVVAVPLTLLHPIMKLTKQDSRKPTEDSRFHVSDLLSLIFLIQVALAFATRFNGSQDGVSYFFYIVWVFVAVSAWLAALVAVNRIGISNQFKRVISAGIVFPGAVLSGPISGMLSLLVFVKGERDTNLLIATAVTLVAVIVIYLLVFWILRDSKLVSS